MELKSSEKNNSRYQLVFSDETEENLIEISIVFDVDWELKFKYFIPNSPLRFTHEFKSDLAVFPVHLPKVSKQYLFTKNMEFLIKETDMPAHVSVIKHPGYNLLAVSFNPVIIDKEKMRKIIETIIKAVEAAKVTEVKRPEPEILEKDPLDDIDEDSIIEFELDDEIKLLMDIEPAEIEKMTDPFVFVENDEEQEDEDD